MLWGLTGFRPAVPEDGWRTVGVCAGPHRTAVWRLLDARWFGVPQRRRRVYVVAGARGVCGPEVLVEPESCGWHPHPRRTSGTGVADTPANGTVDPCSDLESRDEFVGSLTAMDGWERPDNAHAEAGWLVGALGTTGPGGGWRIGPDEAAAGHLIPALTASQQRYDDQQTGQLVSTLQSGPHGHRLDADTADQLIVQGVEDIAAAVTAKWAKGTGGPSGDECQNLVYVKRAHAGEDKDESWDEAEVAPTLNAFDNASAVRATVLAISENTRDEIRLYEDVVPALNGPGGKPGQGYPAILSFDSTYSGAFPIGEEDVSVTIKVGSGMGISSPPAVCVPIQDGRDINKNQNGFGVGDEDDPAYTVDTTGAQAVAYPLARRGRDDGAEWELGEEGVYNALRSSDGGSSQQNGVVAFTAKDHAGDATEDLSPTLRPGALTSHMPMAGSCRRSP